MLEIGCLLEVMLWYDNGSWCVGNWMFVGGDVGMTMEVGVLEIGCLLEVMLV